LISETAFGQILPSDSVSYSGLDNWLTGLIDASQDSGYYTIGGDSFSVDLGAPLNSVSSEIILSPVYYAVDDSLIEAEITSYYIYPSFEVTSEIKPGNPDISDGVVIWFESGLCFVETPDSTYIYSLDLKHKTR
jgi:hypothetical protein